MADETGAGAKPRYSPEMPPLTVQLQGATYAKCMTLALKFPERAWVIRNESTGYAQTENREA